MRYEVPAHALEAFWNTLEVFCEGWHNPDNRGERSTTAWGGSYLPLDVYSPESRNFCRFEDLPGFTDREFDDTINLF